MNNIVSLKGIMNNSVVVNMDDYNKVLKETLKDCSVLGTLINIRGFKNIGKSTILVQFAKENKHLIVVPNKTIAEQFRKQFNYYSIFSQDDLKGRLITSVVFDEGVDLDKLIDENQSRDKEFKIITGYINIPNCLNDDDRNNMIFKQTIIYNLEKEILALGSKINYVREQSNAAEYRNLIQAYKDVVYLYNDITKE